MKSFILVIISVFFLGCSDDSLSGKERDPYSISNSESLEILLATAIPIEGGYSISQQAKHSRVSEIQYRDKGIYYFYVPEEGFTGEEIVKIARADSNGAEVYAETETIYKITVTE